MFLEKICHDDVFYLQTLEFDHRNHTVCWLYHLLHTVVLRCALVADVTVSWDLPPPPMFSLNSMLRLFNKKGLKN